MSQKEMCVAIIGLGQLGRLLAERIEAKRLLLFSRDREKATALARRNQNAEAISESQLADVDLVFFCLSEHQMIEYYKVIAHHINPRAILVNPATLMPTNKLRTHCGGHQWIAMKMIGSVRAMESGARGQLITDSEEARELLKLFVSGLGEVIVGDEAWVTKCNSIATRIALQAAIQVADEIRKQGLPESFIYTAQTLVARGVIQSYADGTLGGFAKGILGELGPESTVSTDGK